MPRLDKAGDYIICGTPGRGRQCGGRLAAINLDGGKRVLAILPGWERGADGIYHEPPNDFIRRQRGHPARRLPPKLTGTHNSRDSYLTPLVPLDGSAIRVRCPDCQKVHDIPREDFNLDQPGGSMTTTPNI